MPAPAIYLRVALLPLVLLACRTRDNPDICTTADECGTGKQCNLTTERCEPIGGPDLGRPDGGRDGPDSAAAADGSGADGSQDAAGTCVTAANCTSDRPICTPAGRCVACQVAADCAGTANRPACVEGACVACQADPTVCKDKTPACTMAGGCAECNSSRECMDDPKAPICVEGKCTRCLSDSQCKERDGEDPGLCLAHLDGRCAKEEDVIFVRSTKPCVEGVPGPGSAEMPFCLPQEALDNVTATRRILLLRGPTAFTPLKVPAGSAVVAGGLISVIGQPSAVVLGGAVEGIRIEAGDIYLRDLIVQEGFKEGVVAEGEATVHMSKCVIKLNKQGGVRVNGGAGFEIENSILDGNAAGFVQLAPFGGAYLGVPAGGRPSVFRFNTVIRNEEVGVACEKPDLTQELSSVLLYDNKSADQRRCTLKSSKEGVDPKFDPQRAYQLTNDSPCKDAGDPNSFPAIDWKGEPRPGGTRSDCGADELQQN